MFLNTKNLILIVSYFCMIGSAKGQKKYELELYKYLITNLDNEYTVLQQDLQKGRDNFTFVKKIPSDNENPTEIQYHLRYKNNYKTGWVFLCEKYKSNSLKYLVRDVIVQGILGIDCPTKDQKVVLNDKLIVRTKAKEDVSGIILLSFYFGFPRFQEKKMRFDYVGMAKAK